jgi:hypothetical protein
VAQFLPSQPTMQTLAWCWGRLHIFPEGGLRIRLFGTREVARRNFWPVDRTRVIPKSAVCDHKRSKCGYLYECRSERHENIHGQKILPSCMATWWSVSFSSCLCYIIVVALTEKTYRCGGI